MSKRDLLLEIGLEEVPARFVPDAVQQLKEKLLQWLSEQHIPFSDALTFATPRRLTVWIKNVAEKQEDQVEEAKGPAKKIALDADGNWNKAAEGFARGQGVTTEDLYFKEVNGVEYVYVTKETKGTETFRLLPSIAQIIESMTFPKNMRWGQHELKYVRPIRWLVALFGEEVIPFSITGISTGKETYGHRFLGSKITIQHPEDYEELLLSQYVIADPEERKRAIIGQLKELEEQNGWVIPVDEDLLAEVTYLVEYPTALHGSFDPDFLNIPPEVLITSMKEHQRYFPVRRPSGELLPHFVTVRNGEVDPKGLVARGNEKVLRARLADARFFYEEDKKLTIPAALTKLEDVVFHEELGTIGDKIKRVREIAGAIASNLKLQQDVIKKVERTAEICKFDLVSQMVYEFPELQGRMGEEYALLAGEEQEVAKGIYEHYMPRFAGDELPKSIIGAVVSVADKIDTIVGCFSIGIVPSGSQDPYALRRQASGIVQIVLQEEWPLTLPHLFSITMDIFNTRKLMQRSNDEVMNDLEQFFSLRIKNRLQELAVRYDVIDAVTQNMDVELHTIFARADILMRQANSEQYKPLVEAFTRVNNLAQKAEINDLTVYPEHFEHQVEQRLYDVYKEVLDRVEQYAKEKQWAQVFKTLSLLREPIEDFFDQVMVMVDNDQVRNNRLALLHHVAHVINHFADFSHIVFSSK